MSPVGAAPLYVRIELSPLQGSSDVVRVNPGLHPGLWAKGQPFGPPALNAKLARTFRLHSRPVGLTSRPFTSTSRPVALTSRPVGLTSQPFTSTSLPVGFTPDLSHQLPTYYITLRAFHATTPIIYIRSARLGPASPFSCRTSPPGPPGGPPRATCKPIPNPIEV